MISGMVENIVKKGENAGYQHFLLLPLFSKAFFFFLYPLSLGRIIEVQSMKVVCFPFSKKKRNTCANNWAMLCEKGA